MSSINAVQEAGKAWTPVFLNVCLASLCACWMICVSTAWPVEKGIRHRRIHTEKNTDLQVRSPSAGRLKKQGVN